MAGNRPPVYLPPFDYTAEYRVVKKFPFKGVDQLVGEQFDKSRVSTRTLRLLYESRFVEKIDGTGAPPRKPPNASIDRPMRQRIGRDRRTGEFIYGLFKNGLRMDDGTTPQPIQEPNSPAQPPNPEPLPSPPNPEPLRTLERSATTQRPRVERRRTKAGGIKHVV